MGSIFHNVPVEFTPPVSVSFPLTRFAWAILPLVAGFVNASVPRNLRLRQGTEDGPEDVAKTKRGTEEVQMVVRGMNPSPKFVYQTISQLLVNRFSSGLVGEFPY